MRPNKKGDRVAVPRSGGYVLTLLYTNLEKSGTSLLFISCNSYWKEHRKGKQIARGGKRGGVEAPQEKKGGPRGGPPQRRLCFNSIIHQLAKSETILFLY